MDSPSFDETKHSVEPQAPKFMLTNVMRRVVRGKYLMLGMTLAGIVAGAAISLKMKPWYYAQAVFLPPKYSDLETTTPASSLLLGASDASDVYLGLLVSRSVEDDVIDHLNLKARFNLNSQGAARAKLFKDSSFGVGRNALVYVTVKADDPQLAADIANAYLDALYRLNSEMTGSSSDLRRVFFEQQMQQQRAELTRVEQDLKQTEEKTGLLLPTNEAQVGLDVIANLQQQIGAAEARLSALLVGETDQAPDVRAARAQLAQLRSQLAEQYAGGASAHQGIASNGSLPSLTLQNEEKQREVKTAEAAYENMLQLYGRARIASIDPGPQLEIVDRALPPEGKSGPFLQRMVVFGAIIGFAISLLYLVLFQPLKVLLSRTRGLQRAERTS